MLYFFDFGFFFLILAFFFAQGEIGLLEGKIIETHPYGRFLTKNLQWSDVGVYKFSKISEDKTFEINKKEVFGKCVIIDDVLISAPHNILTEK